MWIVALQTRIALRRPGFGLPIAVGLLATMKGGPLFSSDWAYYFPWTLPAQPFIRAGQFAGTAPPLGLIGAAVVGLVGLADFLRRGNL